MSITQLLSKYGLFVNAADRLILKLINNEPRRYLMSSQTNMAVIRENNYEQQAKHAYDTLRYLHAHDTRYLNVHESMFMIHYDS